MHRQTRAAEIPFGQDEITRVSEGQLNGFIKHIDTAMAGILENLAGLADEIDPWNETPLAFHPRGSVVGIAKRTHIEPLEALVNLAQ